MTVPVLIDRLLLRRHWALAFEIAENLRLPDAQGKSRILAHWACYKVCGYKLMKHSSIFYLI